MTSHLDPKKEPTEAELLQMTQEERKTLSRGKCLGWTAQQIESVASEIQIRIPPEALLLTPEKLLLRDELLSLLRRSKPDEKQSES